MKLNYILFSGFEQGVDKFLYKHITFCAGITIMIKIKQRDLISLLVRYKNTFKTSMDFALDLSLSDRTVRTYLQDLKDIIQKNGGVIIAKQGYGYQLQVKDRTAFNLFLIEHDFLERSENQTKCREASERKHYLLNLLLLESQRIDIEDLSESLFISSSQLYKDIADINAQLLPFELKLNKNKSIVFVEGPESAKRHFIMRYFFHHESADFFQRLTHSSKFTEAISFETLTMIILDECREANIKLSDVMIQNIVLHLSLSIKRQQSGLAIQNLNMPKSINTTIESQVAQNIINRVESVIGFCFPKEEQMYLTLHLMTKSNCIQRQSDTNHGLALANCLSKLQQETGYPFLQDEQLKNGIMQHLKPMLVRLEQNVKLKNPLLGEIKKNHNDLFMLVKRYCSELPSPAKFKINDDEWGYLVLHFLAAIEKFKNQQKAKVIIICTTGIGSAQLLKNRVEHEFDEKIKIVATKGYYETSPDMLNEVDFIISTIDLSSKVFKVPVFHVSIFLTDYDVQKIRRYLSVRRNPISALSNDADNDNGQLVYTEQIVDDFAADNFYICQEKQHSKEFILGHLLNQLAVNEAKSYKQEMAKQIENRTALGEIFFSSTIIVPHPAIPVGKIAKIGIAIIPNGLFWNHDYPNIHFIFMISPSIYQNPNLAMMTKAIVDLTDDLALQQKMIKSKDYTEFKQFFIKLISKEHSND